MNEIKFKNSQRHAPIQKSIKSNIKSKSWTCWTNKNLKQRSKWKVFNLIILKQVELLSNERLMEEIETVVTEKVELENGEESVSVANLQLSVYQNCGARKRMIEISIRSTPTFLQLI